MTESDDKYFDCNLLEADYNYKSLNSYEDDKDGPLEAQKNRVLPYLIIKKDSTLITEQLIRNFFGNVHIQSIDYRSNYRQYFVNLKNLSSLEAVRSRLDQFPDIVQCIERRPKDTVGPLPTFAANQSNGKIDELTDFVANDDQINMVARTITVSPTTSKHPEFKKIPIVIKTDYTSKGSLLAQNDENSRYLNVKYEFALERHGAYIKQEETDYGQTVTHYRSGRVIVVPNKQPEVKPSSGDAKIRQLAAKCYACHCYTDNCCKFCQMPFCNPTCFKALTPIHKASCGTGKLPIMEQKLLQMKCVQVNLPPSGSSVKITAFEQTNVFYIRSADIVDEVAYYKVLSEVMIQGKRAEKLKELPKLGEIVIYQSNPQMVRAMILNTDNPQSIYVVCIDFGSVEITDLDQLYECSSHLAALPRYAIPVILRGVPRRCMLPNLRGMLYKLDQNYTFKLRYAEHEYHFEKRMQRVALIESELNRSLNRLINTMLTPVDPTLSEQVLTEEYLIHVPLPTGKNIELVVLDNSFIQCGFIHCTTPDFAYEITQLQADIQDYVKSSKYTHYTAPEQHLCIAKYQDKWCRGLCLELVGDGYPTILFLDYGNIVPIHINDIRPYPQQFTFPIMSSEFDILDMPMEPSKELVARLQQKLAIGSIIRCDEVVFDENNSYSLRLNELMK